MASVEQLAELRGDRHLARALPHEAAVQLGARPRAVGEHADAVPAPQLGLTLQQGGERDEGARGVGPAHAPQVGERGRRLLAPDALGVGPGEVAEVPQRRARSPHRHAPEGHVEDVADEVVVRDLLADALQVGGKRAIDRVEVREQAGLAVARLHARGRPREVAHLVGVHAALAKLQLEQARLGGDDHRHRPGAHHELVGLAQVHAALIGGDDQRLGLLSRSPGRDPRGRELQGAGAAVAGVLDLQVAHPRRQPEVALHPGAHRLLLVDAALAAHQEQLDVRAVLVREQRQRRVDRHGDRVFPGRVHRSLVDHHDVTDVRQVVAAGRTQAVHAQRHAGRVDPDLLDPYAHRSAPQGAQSRPPVTEIDSPFT